MMQTICLAPLLELIDTRQIAGEPFRRWFASADFDLIVWFDSSGSPVSFQLCYDKKHAERALTWQPAEGFAHMAVDAGEGREQRHKAAPILIADGQFDANQICEKFAGASGRLPNAISQFVVSKLQLHPSYVPS